MYKVVYDIRSEGFYDFGPMVFYIIAMIIINVIVLFKRQKNERIWYLKLVNILIFLICFSSVVFSYYSFLEYKSVLGQGNCTTYEGVVGKVVRVGRNLEKFEFSGWVFQNQSRILGNKGYGTLSSHGGAIKEGAEIRICVFKGRILLLEVLD